MEIKALHQEWFPLQYSDRYFEKMLQNNVIALGCFIKLPPIQRGSSSKLKKDQDVEIILGSIVTKV